MPIQFIAAGTRTQASTATSRTPTLGIGSQRSGVRIAVITIKSNAVITTATPGWTKISQHNSGTGFSMAVFIAPHTAGNPTLTWTGSTACGATQFYFEDELTALETATIGASSVGTGTGTTASTGSIDSTRADSTFIYLSAHAANNAVSQPTGWTEVYDAGSATDAARLSLGVKPVGASGTPSGATSTTVSASAAWVQQQIELRLLAPLAGVQISEMENSAVLGAGAGVGVAEMEVLALTRELLGVEIAEMEVLALIKAKYRRRRLLILN